MCYASVGVSNSGSGHFQTDSTVAWIPDALSDDVALIDSYSVQQSRPIDDAQNNAILTSAFERNGSTTVRFQRPILSAGGNFDVSILPGEMTLAWSYGENDGSIQTLTQPIYAQHIVRGSLQVDILAAAALGVDPLNLPDQIAGTFTSPNGDYRLNWMVPATRDIIRFDVEADTTGWVGKTAALSSSSCYDLHRRRMLSDQHID